MKFDQAKIDAFKQESGAILTIQELFQGRCPEFDASKKITLVRHADMRPTKKIDGEEIKGTLYEIYRDNKDKFLSYQKEQKKGKLDNFDYVVSFIGERGTKARFVGVYKVGAKSTSPYDSELELYDLQIVDAFEPFTHRVVIEWGRGTNNIWHGYKKFKAVTRIDEGFEDADGVPRFRSYTETILSYEKMKAIFMNDDEDWKTMLKAVNCIYLIQDVRNGKQYVGKTSGRNGIWGRWQTYFMTGGHGDNVELEKMISEDPKYAHNFQWTILETLPINVTEPESSTREKLYKDKLLTRVFGYNKN